MVLEFVLFLKATEPVLLLAVPSVREEAPWTIRLPEAVTVLPLCVKVELPIEPVPVKIAIVPLVPLPVMPPPDPAQLPRATRHMSSLEPPAIAGRL
jgi:hypothetical protein